MKAGGKQALLVLAALALMATAGGVWLAMRPLSRHVDAQPKESVASRRLPSGQATASFEIDTGGDQMSFRSVQAGLVFSARFGNRQFRQTLASCDDAGHGNALASGDPDELDAAVCDDRAFSLRSSAGRVYVQEEIPGKAPRRVSEIRLPDGVERAEYR